MSDSLEKRSGSKSSDGSEGEEQYEIEKILDWRVNSRKKLREFKVHWQGYTSEEDTWEPEENLHTANETLERFLTDHELPSDFDFSTYKKHAQKDKGKETKATKSSRKSRSANKDDHDDDQSDDSSPLTHSKRNSTGRSKKRSSQVESSKAIKSTLERSVHNRSRILQDVPLWMQDEADDDSNKSYDGNHVKNGHEDCPMDESHTQKNDQTISIKPENNGIMNETRSEICDILQDEETVKESEKEKSEDAPADGKKKRASNMNDANKKSRTKKPRKSTQNDVAETSTLNQSNLTFISLYCSEDEHLCFKARDNKNLEQIDISFDEAIDDDPRGVAQFLSGCLNLKPGFSISKE